MIDKISAKIEAKVSIIESCEKAGQHEKAKKHFKELQSLTKLRSAYKEAVDLGLI